MDYNHYDVEDFVLDESFRSWVLGPDTELTSFWNQWLEANPQKAETVARAIEMLKLIHEEEEESLNNQQLFSMTQAIEKGIDLWEEERLRKEKDEPSVPFSSLSVDPPAHKRESATHKLLSSSFLLKVAASAVFVLGMLYVIHQERQQQFSTEVTYEQVVKVAPPGSKLTVKLGDGSEVMLNAGSTIRFTEPFPPDQRIISLEGEAYFQVAHDSLRPFRVKSDLLTTTALGTSFNIAAYPQDNGVQVSLSSGKVKVQYQPVAKDKRPSVFYLVPGQQIGYDKAQETVRKVLFDADKVLAWKKGIIYLDNVDEATAIRTLERWYGIQIEIKGESTTPWEVTARFDNQSLNSVLTSLSYTLGFDFEIHNNQVLITYT